MPPIAAAIAAIGAIGFGVESIVQGQQQASQAKKAANQSAQQQAAALAQLKAGQEAAATQAQNALNAKRAAAASSTDIYTSPLGLTTQANTAKKMLTGQ